MRSGSMFRFGLILLVTLAACRRDGATPSPTHGGSPAVGAPSGAPTSPRSSPPSGPPAPSTATTDDAGEPHEHGARVTGRFAPYAFDDARKLGLDAQHVLTLLFPEGAPSPLDDLTPPPAFISSHAHETGDWTYFMSATVLVYQIVSAGAPGGTLVLYSRSLPGRIIDNVLDVEWRLALLDRGATAVLSETPFRTTMRRRSIDIERDMIYADLSVAANTARVEITYARTGSGSGREQSFVATFEVISAPGRLKLRGVRQTVDR